MDKGSLDKQFFNNQKDKQRMILTSQEKQPSIINKTESK